MNRRLWAKHFFFFEGKVFGKKKLDRTIADSNNKNLKTMVTHMFSTSPPTVIACGLLGISSFLQSHTIYTAAFQSPGPFSTQSDLLGQRRKLPLTTRQASPQELNACDDPTEFSHSVDRAPCFDGVCDSSPDNAPISQAGEATLRLGSMTGPTVWSEFGRISQERDLANLGQGFPDWLPPDFAVESLVSATMDVMKSPHQYTRTAGHPNLVKQLARRYSNHLMRKIDPMNEVAVTVGASQALYLCLQTLVKPGE